MNQKNNVTTLNSKNAFKNALFLLQRNNLDYAIYGNGSFFFAFWRPNNPKTYFVKHATLNDYTLSIQYYAEKEKRGECHLLIFDESGDVSDFVGENYPFPTLLSNTRCDTALT